MELTRRDAVAVVTTGSVGAGVVAGTLGQHHESPGAPENPQLAERDRATLTAVARVLYPSAVDGIAPFVETFLTGRIAERPSHVEALRSSVETIDDHATYWFDAPFRALDSADGDVVLRRMELDRADPDPAGEPAEQVRYYVVDDLLYALYSSPTGASLAGLENPPGHPGGIESYQRGPADE